MNDDRSLVPAAAQQPSRSTLNGTAVPVNPEGEPLRSPVSGTPCVHWRLRIVETMAPGMELVHEVSAPDAMQIAWAPPHEGPARRVKVDLGRAQIEAQPVLHQEGSPGAQAAAQHFGLSGSVRVEEVLIRVGEVLEAEGVLFDPELAAGSPFRAHHGPAELMDARIKIAETALSLKPALLPWALGTAAALLGGSGVATVVAKLAKARVVPAVVEAELRAPLPMRPRWP